MCGVDHPPRSKQDLVFYMVIFRSTLSWDLLHGNLSPNTGGGQIKRW